MAKLFQNGFEEGNLSAWTSQFLTNGAVNVQSTTKRTGAYALQSHTDPTLNLARAQVSKSIALQSEAYARAYVYISEGPESMGTHDRFYFVRLLASDNATAVMGGLRREGTQPLRWVMWYRRGASGNGSHTYGSIVEPASVMNRWICIELHYNQSTGLQELYVDGVLQISVDPSKDSLILPSQLPTILSLEAGVYKSGATGQTYDPTTAYNITVFVDDCIIAQEYIGSDTPIQPKLTVTSSPELNVPVYVDNQFLGNTPIVIELPSGTHTVRVEEEVTR